MCTEDCGRLEPPDEHALANSFSDVGHRAFAEVAGRHELTAEPVQLYDVAGQRSPVSPDRIRFPFLAMFHLNCPTLSVRVSYGHREYQLDVEAARDRGDYHPLRSWLAAVGSEAGHYDDSWLTGVAALEHHLLVSAQLLDDHLPAMLAAEKTILAELGDTPAPTTSTINRRLEAAQAAFATGDYHMFVDLLATLEDVLTTSDRQRLAFARARL